MNLSFKPYTLELKHEFTVSVNSRTSTPIVITELEHEGVIGYGEASMPPYLGESHESVFGFLSKVDLSQYNDPYKTEEILKYVDGIEVGNTAAKASIDIALYDLQGKLLNQPIHRIWGYSTDTPVYTSMSIGIDKPEIIAQRVKEAESFKILKLKLGRGNDKEIINTVRSLTDKPICVDVNQGWKDKHQALEMIHWLKEKNVIFVEQPLPKEMIDDMAWLTAYSPIPTIADEALQRLSDVVSLKDVYSGINIKLMKCTGLHEAHQMVILAKSLGMKIMIGCMIETSCAISAASQLAMKADYVDLDGMLLIKNDLFEGTKIVDGKVVVSKFSGIGVKKI